jgi:hypothetical protein
MALLAMVHEAAGATEVRALLGEIGLQVDPLVVDRIVELGASAGEICEAADVNGRAPRCDPMPSSDRVAEIRALLAELLEDRRRRTPADRDHARSTSGAPSR